MTNHPTLSLTGWQLDQLAKRVAEAEANHPPEVDVDGKPWNLHGDLSLCLEDGEWEIEYCVLDPGRNISLKRATAAEAVRAVYEHDNEALRAQGRTP